MIMVLITGLEVEKDQTNVDIKIKQWVEEWNGEQLWYVLWTDSFQLNGEKGLCSQSQIIGTQLSWCRLTNNKVLPHKEKRKEWSYYHKLEQDSPDQTPG